MAHAWLAFVQSADVMSDTGFDLASANQQLIDLSLFFSIFVIGHWMASYSGVHLVFAPIEWWRMFQLPTNTYSIH